MKQIIESDFKVASIISKNSNGIISSLLKQFEDKKVLLLQQSFCEYPCETILITTETDLLELSKNTVNEFDLLIIEILDIGSKSKKMTKFIKAISKLKHLKDKQIVILFKSNDCSKNMEINSFGCYKRAVLVSSDKIYTLSADNHHYFMNELTTCQTRVFRHF